METFFDLMRQSAANGRGNELCFVSDESSYSISFETFYSSVNKLASFLASKGREKEEKAIIMLESSPNWLICDLGIAAAGLISVPMFSTLAPENMLYQFQNCGAKIIFFQNEATFDAVQKLGFKFELSILL